ncbi:MAG: four helix bundle protein [Pirellulaceae bacterium]
MGFEGADSGVFVAGDSDVFGAAEDDRCAGHWEAGAAVRNVGGRTLAHYREGCRARSDAEFVSKLEGGLQELEETAYWLELLEGVELFPMERLLPLQNEANELTAIFVTCVKKRKIPEDAGLSFSAFRFSSFLLPPTSLS